MYSCREGPGGRQGGHFLFGSIAIDRRRTELPQEASLRAPPTLVGKVLATFSITTYNFKNLPPPPQKINKLNKTQQQLQNSENKKQMNTKNQFLNSKNRFLYPCLFSIQKLFFVSKN